MNEPASDPASDPAPVDAATLRAGMGAGMGAVLEAKRAMRRRMREVRREVVDQAGRSTRIWEVVRELPAVAGSAVVMVYEAVQGEPDSSGFVAWCRTQGKVVVIPDPSPTAVPPVDPLAIDVAIVPGLAFTGAGCRLGQGGGWYDRVLAQLRSDASTVGVCFEAQLVDAVPSEPHDVVLDVVVTEAGVRGGAGTRAGGPREQ